MHGRIEGVSHRNRNRNPNSDLLAPEIVDV